MNEEKVEYKQINVLVPVKDLESLDKQVKNSKFKSRSEYIRFLIENALELFEQQEALEENIKEAKSIAGSFKTIKPALIELFKIAEMDEEMKEEALAILTGEALEEERG
jgi:Arc/MetJ-type ribon-helix-helix transcriptional regulator